MTDVFRVFLQFSEKVSDEHFDEVKLCCRGKEKVRIEGSYFLKLGREYFYQNVIYTLRTFHENLMHPDGSSAYPTWTGGTIGVSLKQMEDYSDFHRKWYIEDMVRH